jgi:glycosyltransferase involved in cell wall biosynthesis
VKVLWLIKGLGPGGAEQLLLNQARVRDRGLFDYEVAYLVPWKDHLADALRAEGVAVHCLEGPREWDLRWARRLRHLLSERQIDIVHVHSPYVATFTRATLQTIPRRRRPALVSTEHNRWPRHKRLTRLANRLTIPVDDHVIAVSADVRSTMPPRVARHVEVLTHGVNLADVRAQSEARDEVRAELGIGAGEVVVGTVANLRKEKGYHDLLAAAAEVLRTTPAARFVAVGQGPLADDIAGEHERLELGDRFALLGYRDDAVRVMSAFDLFVLASHHEGLPIALLDALALGIPVVCTDVGGISAAVTDKEHGLLVPAGHPTQLAQAISELVADDERRAAMAAAARRRGDDFGIEPAVRRIEAIYQDAAADRLARSRS